MHIELRYDGEYPDEKILEVIKVINKSIINSVKKAYKKVHLRNIPDYKVKYLDFIEDSLDTNDIQNQVDALTEKYGMLTVTNVNVNRKREITSSDERYYALTTI
jgi:predicted phage-related endonuclease